jgi:ribosomal protein L37E
MNPAEGEEAAAAAVKDPNTCQQCLKAVLAAGQKFCAQCGFPQGGTEEEKTAYHRKKAMARVDGEERDKRVKSARNVLFLVAALNMLPYLMTKNGHVIVVGLIISLLYVGMAIWAKHKPFPALLTALVLFVAINLFAMIEDPHNIYRGVLMKFFAVSALVYALRAIQRADASARDR